MMLEEWTPRYTEHIVNITYIYVDQGAEAREAAAAGSQRQRLRTLAAIAVLRQTALLLRHYGIHCAHFYQRKR